MKDAAFAATMGSHMNDFVISQAIRKNTAVFIALAGTTGTGKTRSALELATGLAGETGKILFADTEGSRALHYADLYKFDHVEWKPPFTPEQNASLIELAEKNGYSVLIIDSESDEMEGEGGLQEIAKSTNDDFWAKTKARHKHALVNRMRRAKIHIIFCLRCEERVKIHKDVNGRTQIEPLGWMPICEKRFMYEVQSSFLFLPGNPGIPSPIKRYDFHERFFPADRQVSRAAGQALAEWAAGGSAPQSSAHSASAPTGGPLGETLDAIATDIAKQGSAAFRSWWTGLGKPQRDSIRGYLSRYEGAAREADELGEAAAGEAGGAPAAASERMP